MAELEAGLSALLSGQAIPPAAAAALIAAISKMGTPSTQLVQALSKGGSVAGNASRGGKGSSRNPSEGAALSAGGRRAALHDAEAKPKGASVLAQPAAEDSAELDSVIQTINQVNLARRTEVRTQLTCVTANMPVLWSVPRAFVSKAELRSVCSAAEPLPLPAQRCNGM